MIERGTQATVVIVLKRHKPKRLQHPIGHAPHWAESFGHAVYWTGQCLKSDFDEIALAERLGQPEQAAGHGNGLEFRLGAPAVF